MTLSVPDHPQLRPWDPASVDREGQLDRGRVPGGGPTTLHFPKRRFRVRRQPTGVGLVNFPDPDLGTTGGVHFQKERVREGWPISGTLAPNADE